MRVLDFGLAQFDEADTLTAVGDVPGTLAYISPGAAHRRGGDRAERRLGGRRDPLGGARRRSPVLGRPAPRGRLDDRCGRAAALGASAATCRDACSPPSTPRSRSIRRSAARCPARRRAARGVPPRGGPPRAARESPCAAGRRRHERPAAARRRAGRSRRAGCRGAPPSAAPCSRSGPRRSPSLAVAAGLTTWRTAARAGARARGAGVPARERRAGRGRRLRRARARLARRALARRAAGLLFCAGPLLAPLGLLALLPLVVQPVARAWRRALHAGIGVLAGGGRRRARGRRAPARRRRPSATSAIAQTERPARRRPRARQLLGEPARDRTPRSPSRSRRAPAAAARAALGHRRARRAAHAAPSPLAPGHRRSRVLVVVCGVAARARRRTRPVARHPAGTRPPRSTGPDSSG